MASIPLLRLSLPLHHHHHYRRQHVISAAVHLPHPLKTTLPSHHIFRHPSPKPITTTTTCSYNPTPTLTRASDSDRLISAVSYFFTFFNGLQYSRFIFVKYPIMAAPFQPLIPLLSLYHSAVLYTSIVTFFVLYLGISKNPNFSRYARFNAQQAVNLDVLLALPLFLQRKISPGLSGIALKIAGWAYFGLFLFVVACIIYGFVSSIKGKTPYLPFSDAAD